MKDAIEHAVMRFGLYKAREALHYAVNTDLSRTWDIPTCRAFNRDYYLKDPYLDVMFMTADGWCRGRFMHDSVYSDLDEICFEPIPGMIGRRFHVSPGLLKAIYRVLKEA